MERLELLSRELLDVLARERQALVNRALPELDGITAEKARLCSNLDAAVADLGPIPLRRQIDAFPSSRRQTLEPMHQRLLDLAAETQKCNAVNGKIVHRSQQSVRELMHLMSGTDTDPLYSSQGYRSQGPSLGSTTGPAITKA
jgi:flagellar biosynthesis/type III secretory pathway chaperone